MLLCTEAEFRSKGGRGGRRHPLCVICWESGPSGASGFQPPPPFPSAVVEGEKERGWAYVLLIEREKREKGKREGEVGYLHANCICLAHTEQEQQTLRSAVAPLNFYRWPTPHRDVELSYAWPLTLLHLILFMWTPPPHRLPKLLFKSPKHPRNGLQAQG